MSETTDRAGNELAISLRLWMKGIEITNTQSDARVTIIVNDWAEARLVSRHIAEYVSSYWTDVLKIANAERDRATEKINTLHANSPGVMADIEKSKKQTGEEAKTSDKPKEAKSEEEECF